MAHPGTGTPAGVQRLTGLVATVAVAVAVSLAFGRAFEGAATTGKLLVIGVGTAVLAWAFERRSLLLATLAAVALLVAGLGILVFPETTWYGVPSLHTGSEMLTAAGAVGEQARLQTAPTPPVVPLVFAAVTAVWAAVFSCHALAFRAGSPLLGLVPPAALIVFADSVLEEFVRPLYGVLFLIAALAVLFADSVRRVQGWGPIWSGPTRRDRLAPSAGRNARRIAGAAIAVAVVAPFVVPGFGGRSVIDLSRLNAEDDVTVSALVAMSSQLTTSDPVDVFQVQSPQDTYWRLTSLEHFDGNEWSVGTQSLSDIVPGQTLPGAIDGETYQQTFTMQNDMPFPNYAPTGFQPSSVALGDDAAWDSESLTLIMDEPLSDGDTYTVTSTYVKPSAAELRATDTASAIGTELTELPDGMPPQIGELARQIVREAEVEDASDYEQVMAIQDYLRSDEFEYDTSAAYHEDTTSLLEFLTLTQAGFCQHFAIAMAVLLRELGIPARIAVGFTRGQSVRGQTDAYRVTTKELHSWVEVPFLDYGWLSFEPTKGSFANGLAPYANPDPGPDPDPGSTQCIRGVCPSDGVSVTASPTDGRSDAFEPDTGLEAFTPFGAQANPVIRWATIAAIALLVMGAIGLVWLFAARRIRRRRALARAASEPRAAIVEVYRGFTHRAGALGYPRASGETPSEYATRLRDAIEETERLDRLTVATIAAAYGPEEPTTDDALDATSDADELTRSMRRSLPLRRRVRSTLEV